MSSPLNNHSKISNAINTNQMFNYIQKNTNNNLLTYHYNDLQPSNIYPNGGVFNNMRINPYQNNPFTKGLPIDYFNPIGTNYKISKPLFNREDDVLPDLIQIGINNSKNARMIGTAIY